MEERSKLRSSIFLLSPLSLKSYTICAFFQGTEKFQAFGSGTIKKGSLNRRGYNKFLEITKDVGISINEEKVANNERWDGWNGYITNTTLGTKDVVSQYHGLLVVERAFRKRRGSTLYMGLDFQFVRVLRLNNPK